MSQQDPSAASPVRQQAASLDCGQIMPSHEVPTEDTCGPDQTLPTSDASASAATSGAANPFLHAEQFRPRRSV